MAPSSPSREAPPAKNPNAPPEQKKRKTAPPAKSTDAPPEQKKRKKTEPPPHPPEAKREPVPFQRTWPPGDEVRILEALAAHRRAHGGDLPKPAVLFAALDGHLERKGVDAKKIMEKLRSFKRRYVRDAKKTAPPAGEHERRLYLLSRDVWAGDSPPKPPPVAQAKSLTPLKAHTAEDTKDSKDAIKEAKSAREPAGKDLPKPRTLAEMREMYPYLVGEAMILMDPPNLQELLPSIEENVARALNKKIKKVRKKLAKAIEESARMKNMETPTVLLCQSTKLQVQKPTMDKKDGECICNQGRFAQLEHEVAELRQIVMASQCQGKKHEYAESGVLSVIAENQISCNIKVPNVLPHRKNEVVTSKLKFEGVLPSNVPRDSLKLQGLIKPPCNVFHGRMTKIDTHSQTRHNMVGKEVVLLSVVRPRIPVGKAILENSSQSTIVDGITLGTQWCKVFLSEVLQRDAALIHPNGETMKLSDALKRSIAWPSSLIRYSAIKKAAPHRPSHQGR